MFAQPHPPDSPEATARLPSLAALTRTRALESGALQPILTETAVLEDHGLRFRVRWISSLNRKHAARERCAGRRTADFNPFLPPDPALTVAPLGADHLVVLNKFPVIDNHLLIITRHFEAQTAALTAPDLLALASILGPHGGLGFYNGGPEAGASQRHKHLQWIPRPEVSDCPTDDRLQPFAGQLDPACTTPQHNPALPYRHVFVSLAGLDWTQATEAGQQLHAASQRAFQACGIAPTPDALPPYNLLVDRDWLLLVPRSREHWEDISVNALGFAGSLFVRRVEQIDALRSLGALRLLAAVGLPA